VAVLGSGQGLWVWQTRVLPLQLVLTAESVLEIRIGESTTTFGKLSGREQKQAVRAVQRREAVLSCCSGDVQ